MENEQHLKLVLPPMVEGQTGWGVYVPYEVAIGRSHWPLSHRVMWRAMMWAHDRVEALWHWLWDAAQRFREPPPKTETRYIEIPVEEDNA